MKFSWPFKGILKLESRATQQNILNCFIKCNRLVFVEISGLRSETSVLVYQLYLLQSAQSICDIKGLSRI
jgi:hypothetical protein